MAYRDYGSTTVGLPAQVDILIARLPPAALQRARERLSETVVLAERLDPSTEYVLWGALGGTALATSIGFAVAGLGVAEGGDAHSIAAALIHATAALFVARSAIGIAHAASSRGPLGPGRILLPTGLLEIHGARMRVLPADRIANVEVKIDPPGSYGLSLIHIVLHPDEGAPTELVLAGTPANVKQLPLELLRERGAAIREARARGDVDELARLEILSRVELAGARAPSTSLLTRMAAQAWTTSAALGIAFGALAFAVIMPLMALPAAQRFDNADAWGALERTYPVPWVASWSREAIANRRAAARAPMLERVRPEYRDALGAAIAWLDANDRRELRVGLEYPPSASIEAADAWLRSAVPESASPAPIVLVRAYLGGSRDGGSGPFAAAMQHALEVPEDVLRLTPEGAWDEAVAGPRVIVTSDVRPTSALAGEGARTYAALEFTFTVRLEVPGREAIVLGDPITVSAMEHMEVTRSDMGDLRGAPLDPTGISSIDMLEDSLVYVAQLERAQSEAGALVVARLLAP